MVVWGAVLGGVYAAVTRSRAVAAVTLALLVMSHWVLDFITHRPDMPLTPFGPERYGLNLWSSLRWTLVAECGIFAAGVWLYTRATKARDKVGSIAFWGMVLFLSAVMIANVFSPPPPSVTAVAWTAQAMWLLVILGAWIDRHRYLR